MGIDPNAFWDSSSPENPPLTDAMVRDAENELGVKLPKEYLDLLRLKNGGYTNGFGFPMSQKTSWADDHVPLPDLKGIALEPFSEGPLSVRDNSYLCEEWGLPPKQVLLSGDGHYWLTLDYRNGEVPSVSWIDVECDEDISVAPTSAAFFDGLRPDEEFDFDLD